MEKDKYVSSVTKEDKGAFMGVTSYLKDLEVEENTCCYLFGNPYMLREVEVLI